VSHPLAHSRREAILAGLGIRPPLADLVAAALDDAIARAETSAVKDGRAVPGGPPAIVALDAGCGRRSALARYRRRIGTLVGVDIHQPEAGSMPYLDAFVRADVCADEDAFAPATFDLVLSAFTAEHFLDPAAAFRNLSRWLRPGGTLLLTTVNRRHPFVAAYLAIPPLLRGRVQRLVKKSAEDAHPLVGACNDPRAIRAALEAAGFADIRILTVGHLARAWGLRRLGFAAGLVGDLLTHGRPSRRSTLVATARRADGPRREVVP
jgi:SAM-dependent methyltransferase